MKYDISYFVEACPRHFMSPRQIEDEIDLNLHETVIAFTNLLQYL